MSLVTPRKGYKSVPWLFGKEIEIPEEWEVEKFRTKIKMEYGSGLTEDKRDNLKNPVYGSGGLIGLHSKPKVKGSGIIVARKGSLGNVFFEKDDFFPIDTVYYITQKETELNLKFLFYYLLHMKLENLRIVTSKPGISREDVYSYRILSIPLPEQQKITTILSNVDNLIESTGKVITHSKKVKTGLMQKLLTRGIGHTKFKKVNFGRHFIDYDIPEEWKIYRLGNHATVHGRIGWKNLRSNEYLEEGFLMLSVWSLVETASFGINYTEGIKRLSKFRYDESPEIQLQNNDILIAKDGDIGRIGYIKNLPEPATVNSHVVPVRVTDKIINPEFLYWFFKSKPFQTYCKAFTSGTTIPLFTQKDLRNCIIPIPKKEEQDKIVIVLSNIDAQIDSQTQYKEKLEQLKKSLMQKLLTGEVRV
jgi:type I restriction enzyme, S subunit